MILGCVVTLLIMSASICRDDTGAAAVLQSALDVLSALEEGPAGANSARRSAVDSVEVLPNTVACRCRRIDLRAEASLPPGASAPSPWGDTRVPGLHVMYPLGMMPRATRPFARTVCADPPQSTETCALYPTSGVAVLRRPLAQRIGARRR
jgi:hypothetical protein